MTKAVRLIHCVRATNTFVHLLHPLDNDRADHQPHAERSSGVGMPHVRRRMPIRPEAGRLLKVYEPPQRDRPSTRHSQTALYVMLFGGLAWLALNRLGSRWAALLLLCAAIFGLIKQRSRRMRPETPPTICVFERGIAVGEGFILWKDTAQILFRLNVEGHPASPGQCSYIGEWRIIGVRGKPSLVFFAEIRSVARRRTDYIDIDDFHVLLEAAGPPFSIDASPVSENFRPK